MKHAITLSAVALTAALALTGCGGGDSGAGDTGGGTESSSAPAATSSPTPSAEATTPATDAPSGTAEAIDGEHNDEDVMFARMMIPHHQQAVQMSELLLAKDEIPTEVTDFAQKVIDAQGPEIDRMNAMLEAWGQEPMGMDEMGDMGGMDHGSMSGMMSQEDMQELEDATGTEAARLYLEQMTAHHEGAIEMAQDEVDQGQNPQALHLAQEMVTAQQAEIAEMEQLLQQLSAS